MPLNRCRTRHDLPNMRILNNRFQTCSFPYSRLTMVGGERGGGDKKIERAKHTHKGAPARTKFTKSSFA